MRQTCGATIIGGIVTSRVRNLCDKSCEFVGLHPTYTSQTKCNMCPKFTQHGSDSSELNNNSKREDKSSESETKRINFPRQKFSLFHRNVETVEC